MKKVMFILIAFLTLYSCKNDNEDCEYNLTNHPNDTSLFVKFSIDGIDYKYYQEQSIFIGMGLPPIKNGNNSETLCYKAFYFTFESLDFNNSLGLQIWLTVWGRDSKMPPTTPSYQFFNADNLFVSPKENISLSDTAYLKGVSLSIGNGNSSTGNLMKYFNYNYDTIYNDILKDSYFKVTNIEAKCNYYYLIEGEFETVLMSGLIMGKEQKLIKIKKGKVRFITYY